MIDYSRFRLSLERLREQHANNRCPAGELPDLMREAVAESVIWRFKTCYDCLWKVLKRHLSEGLGMPDTPNSPKPIFRLAHENDLLGAPVDRWLEYADARINTSHDYDGEKARACLRLMPDFIDDAKRVFHRLSQSA